MGNNKPQEGHFVLNRKGEVLTLVEDTYKPQVTLYFKNCHDCNYVVDSMCTKIMIESCKNTKFTFNKKIVTSVVEVYKCDDTALHVNTAIGTLQLDVCKKLHIDVSSTDHFKHLYWTAVHDLTVSFADNEELKLNTGFHKMKAVYPHLDENIDQFITRILHGKLQTEQLVRLQNGFPTTEREAREFDRRQEEAIQKLAKESGITIGRKKPAGPKLKPNDPCNCGSGFKYKKCHGRQDI